MVPPASHRQCVDGDSPQLSRHELDELDSNGLPRAYHDRLSRVAPSTTRCEDGRDDISTDRESGVESSVSVRCEMTRHAATDNPHIHTGERIEIRFASLHRHDPDERPGLHSRVTDWTPAPTARQHSNKDDPKQKDDC